MPRWCLPLPAFSIVFLLQESLTTTATLFDGRESRLQARGTNVLEDKYFIPGIATLGALVVLGLVCLYFLGCCCNSKKMEERYSASTALPTRQALRNSASYQRPTVNLNSADVSDKYSNLSHPKTTPQTTPPAPPSVRLQQLDGWSNNNNNNNGTQWGAPPLPTSHGFQPSPAHTAVPPSVMSVQHLNSTAASYHHRESQIPRPLPTHHQQHIQPQPPDARRVSSMSSATSSTQIGSGIVEQAPYVYSPHQGNTLSYASSTSPSMAAAAPVWDGSAMPRMPSTNENLAMVGGLDKQGYSYPQQVPTPSGPPAYIDDVKGRPSEMRKS